MRRLFWMFALLLLLPQLIEARSRFQSFCETGGVSVTVPGTLGSGTQKFQRSYPSCTVAVYLASSHTLAAIYSDDVGTSKANPFTAASNGQWFFYANDGRYTVELTGGGISGAVTLADIPLFDLMGGVSSTVFLNGGNAFGSTFATLGTTNNKDLAIITNGVERARVLGSGTYKVETDLMVSGYSAFCGSALYDTVATGYVGIICDKTWINTDNEVRGIHATVRNKRTIADAAWDFFAIGGAAEVATGNTQHITGQMKGVVAELYFQPGVYTVDKAVGLQSNIPTLGAGVTVTDWYGLAVNAPPAGGTITNGRGIWIENLNANGNPPTNSYAIQIDGIGNYGRIKWQHATIQESPTNYLELNATTAIVTVPGLIVGAGGSQGVNAGSYAIGGTTIIDGSGNVSTTGYGNFSYLQVANVGAPGTPAGGYIRLYAKSDATDPVGSKLLYYKDSGSNEYVICNTGTCAGGGGGTISGTGTATYIPKFTAATVIANSILTDNGAGAMVLTGTNHFDSAGGYYVAGVQVIDSSKSIGNVVNMSASGYMVATGRTAGSYLTLTNATAPGAPGTGYTHVYIKADGTDPLGSKKLYYKDSAANEYALYPAVIGGITGSGTTGTVPKFTGASAIGDSILTDNGAGAMVLTGTNHFDSAGGYYVATTQVIDGSRSIGNVVNVIASGYMTAVGRVAGAYLTLADGAAPGSPGAGYVHLYPKVGEVGVKNLYYKDSGGTEYTVCNTVTCPGGGGGISGSGTTNTITKFTGATAVGNSIMTEAGGSAIVLTGANHFDSAGGYYVAGTQVIDGSRNIGNVVNISNSGSVSATGNINTSTGFRINAAAPVRHYLVGNGSYYVDGTIQVGDIPSHAHAGTDITSGTVSASYLPVATGAAAGIVSTASQTFGGAKYFAGDVLPNSSVGYLGGASYRWNLTAHDISFDGTMTGTLGNFGSIQVLSGTVVTANRGIIHRYFASAGFPTLDTNEVAIWYKTSGGGGIWLVSNVAGAANYGVLMTLNP